MGRVIFCVIIVFFCVIQVQSRSRVPSKLLTPRIINGVEARPGQFPWQVAINGRDLCGGSLISDQWIVTAAHCMTASKYKIQLGTTLLVGEDPNRIVMESEEYIIHEHYNSRTLENDIALILLPEAVTFTDYIRPIYLSSQPMPVSTEVVVSGWGLTSDANFDPSNTLQYVSIYTISDRECRDAYDGNFHNGVVCAIGFDNYGKVQGSCEGDSGGPLVDDSQRLIGIVSYGHEDGCESGKPSAFTRVDYFRNWIKEHSGI